MRSFLSIIAAPTLCLGVLGGIVWDNGHHARRRDAEPFHQHAKRAVAAWSESAGPWTGVDHSDTIPAAAQKLLRPNALRYYIYTRPGNPGGLQQMHLLLVQCSEPDDMSGHYPPNCFPRSGRKQMGEAKPRQWVVPGLATPIVGAEYAFARRDDRERDTVVYNFFILPGRGFRSEMADVRTAAGDYERMYYGATQVQVWFASPSDPAARDAAFVQLMSANADVLKTLNPL